MLQQMPSLYHKYHLIIYNNVNRNHNQNPTIDTCNYSDSPELEETNNKQRNIRISRKTNYNVNP